MILKLMEEIQLDYYFLLKYVMQNMSLIKCLQGAYDIISKRTGKMIDGQFVKNA